MNEKDKKIKQLIRKRITFILVVERYKKVIEIILFIYVLKNKTLPKKTFFYLK
jgi:hypothetical protein